MTGHSRLLFLDDSKHNECPRDGIGSLVAIGGICVSADRANELNRRLKGDCLEKFGLAADTSFKWSPPKNSLFRINLSDSQRGDLIKHVLSVLGEFDPFAIVALCETATSPVDGTDSHEMSALMMVMERFHNNIGSTSSGIIVIDRPAGGKTDEENYLTECADIVATGSKYAEFNKIACPIVSMPFKLSRILQVADLVVSITASYFAGHSAAAEFFPYVLPLFKTNQIGRRGGVSVKLHPDSKYVNLYHWLLDDEHFTRGNLSEKMPLVGKPYARSPTVYL
jgi:hypothetical protein